MTGRNSLSVPHSTSRFASRSMPAVPSRSSLWQVTQSSNTAQSGYADNLVTACYCSMDTSTFATMKSGIDFRKTRSSSSSLSSLMLRSAPCTVEVGCGRWCRGGTRRSSRSQSLGRSRPRWRRSWPAVLEAVREFCDLDAVGAGLALSTQILRSACMTVALKVGEELCLRSGPGPSGTGRRRPSGCPSPGTACGSCRPCRPG